MDPPQPVWAFSRREKFLAPAKTETLDHPATSLVNVLTMYASSLYRCPLKFTDGLIKSPMLSVQLFVRPCTRASLIYKQHTTLVSCKTFNFLTNFLSG